MEDQVARSQEREMVWCQEYHTSHAQFQQLSSTFESTKQQVVGWMSREGQAAQSIVRTFQDEIQCARVQIEMIEQQANITHTREMRAVEEEATKALRSNQDECFDGMRFFAKESSRLQAIVGVIGSDRLHGIPISVQPQSSGPFLNSLPDGSVVQSQSSQYRAWTDVFMQTPTALPPGLAIVDSMNLPSVPTIPKQTVLAYHRQ
eukprot:5558749-Amphidinium_carterae.1